MVVLREGRVRAVGERRAVFAAPPDPETAAFLGYALVPADGGLAAIAPGALRPGAGDFTLSFRVEEVVDLVAGVEASGRVGGARVAAVFPPDAPVPARGDRVVAGAPASAVARFPRAVLTGPRVRP